MIYFRGSSIRMVWRDQISPVLKEANGHSLWMVISPENSQSQALRWLHGGLVIFLGDHLFAIFATQVCFKVKYLQKWINWPKTPRNGMISKLQASWFSLRIGHGLNGWRRCFGSINGSSCLGRTSSNFRSIRPYLIQAWKVVFLCTSEN